MKVMRFFDESNQSGLTLEEKKKQETFPLHYAFLPREVVEGTGVITTEQEGEAKAAYKRFLEANPGFEEEPFDYERLRSIVEDRTT